MFFGESSDKLGMSESGRQLQGWAALPGPSDCLLVLSKLGTSLVYLFNFFWRGWEGGLGVMHEQILNACES